MQAKSKLSGICRGNVGLAGEEYTICGRSAGLMNVGFAEE